MHAYLLPHDEMAYGILFQMQNGKKEILCQYGIPTF
jgi:hypothetical protein